MSEGSRFREQKVEGRFRADPGQVQGRIRQGSGTVQGRFREGKGKVKEVSGKVSESF